MFVSAISWAPGRLDLFATGSDGQVYHHYYEGKWGLNGRDSQWEQIGRTEPGINLITQPTVVIGAPKPLFIFCVSNNNKLYKHSYGNTKSVHITKYTWEQMSGLPIFSKPSLKLPGNLHDLRRFSPLAPVSEIGGYARLTDIFGEQKIITGGLA